jgi:hypothetical protein
MTLQSFLEEHDDVFVQPFGNTVAKQVFDGHPDLFHLSDYVVTASASGPSLILCPRTNIQQKDAA